MASKEQYQKAKSELIELRDLLSKANDSARPELKKRCNEKKAEVNGLKKELSAK